MDLPDNWYEEHDGQRLVLNPDKVQAEIERLRGEIKRLRAEIGQVREILSDREAEIERLRTEGQQELARCIGTLEQSTDKT